MLAQIELWYWLIAGVVMIIVEILSPTAYFLWMGISAIVVGLLLFALPEISLLIQAIIFGVLSMVSLLIYKRYKKANPIEKDVPKLNRRGEQYVGRIFTLDEAIINGVGKVKVDDSSWKVKGTDMPAGTKVKVVSVDGTVFHVEGKTIYTQK